MMSEVLPPAPNDPGAGQLAHIQDRLRRSPYVRFIGARCELHGDELTLILPYRDDLIGNPFTPALHGGVIGATLEIACIAQLVVQLGLSGFPKPVDVSVDYLRIGRPVDTFARARVRRQGSRVANVHAQAWQDRRDAPIAEMHGHFVLPREDAPPA